MIGCTIFQGSIVAKVVEEVGGPVTSRAILSLLQAPGGVQALRSKNIKLSVFVFCGRKLRYIAFTCKICQEIYQNQPEYDSSVFATKGNCTQWEQDMRNVLAKFNIR